MLTIHIKLIFLNTLRP